MFQRHHFEVLESSRQNRSLQRAVDQSLDVLVDKVFPQVWKNSEKVGELLFGQLSSWGLRSLPVAFLQSAHVFVLVRLVR